jgi:hypothetical protein
MRDSDIDTLSSEGANDGPNKRIVRDHYDEAPRTFGKRTYYRDRLGRRRWRPATPEEQADASRSARS